MKENNNNTTNQFSSTEMNSNKTKIACPISPLVSKICIAVVFTVIGFCSATLAQNISKDKVNSANRNLAQLANDTFFPNDDIFKEVALMEKNMNDMFIAHRQNMAKIFDQASKNNALVNKTSVSNRQDDANYYYDLVFFGFKKEDIVVAIKDGILTFSAKQDQDKSDENRKLKSSSNFYYSFSVPEYNTKIEPEITKEDNKVTVKFVKILLKKTADSKK